MQVVLKPSKEDKSASRVVPYRYKRRVYEVRSPCQWLGQCQDGKCPAFLRIDGNFYCAREGIP